MKTYTLFLIIFLIFPQSVVDKKHDYRIYFTEKPEYWAASKYEKTEIVFKDGLKIYITSDEFDKISMTATDFFSIIQDMFKRKISDIATITHNHFDTFGSTGKQKSSPDQKFLIELRKHGFTGQFIIWFNGEYYKY